MHAAAYRFVESVASKCRGPVYEIGSRDINGSVRPLFGAVKYLGVDLKPGPGVDVVGDALDYLPPFEPQTVVCCEVLEHCAAAILLVMHACGLVPPGGALILTTAGAERPPHSALDGGPLRPFEFYLNWPRVQLESAIVAHGLTVLRIIETPLDVYIWATRLNACGDDPA